MKAKKKKPVSTHIHFRVGDIDLAALTRLADEFTKGNISAWLRYAGLMYTPSENDKKYLARSVKGSTKLKA